MMTQCILGVNGSCYLPYASVSFILYPVSLWVTQRKCSWSVSIIRVAKLEAMIKRDHDYCFRTFPLVSTGMY